MFFITALFGLFCVTVISAISITASDLPECAVECYCYTGEKLNIPVTEYEKQCRSAPFQIALRKCTEIACNHEEFEFVYWPPPNWTNFRLNSMQRNIVPNLELILIRFLRSIIKISRLIWK